MIFESVPNFSEGRRGDVIDAIAKAAGKAHLLDSDPDPDHNRVVVSIAGGAGAITEGLLGAIAEAVKRIDLRRHHGVHPRVGAADVVPVIPLGGTTLDESRALAHDVGRRVWSELKVPVYFYGHGERLSLADIRAGRATPSSAGLRGVQALAFSLSGRHVQLSMNLFRVDETTPADVIAELERRGVAMGAQQVVGLCPAVAAGPAADGRLLEARLASAAAIAGATRCEARGDEESSALARRLRREAGELASLPAGQDAVLGGAERAAALARVLEAAHALDAEPAAMLEAAARGFRAAVTPSTAAIYRARVDALDARL